MTKTKEIIEAAERFGIKLNEAQAETLEKHIKRKKFKSIEELKEYVESLDGDVSG